MSFTSRLNHFLGLVAVSLSISSSLTSVTAFDMSRNDNVRQCSRISYSCTDHVLACSLCCAYYPTRSQPKSNLILYLADSYWGQNSYGATHSDVANYQKTLSFYCQVSGMATQQPRSPSFPASAGLSVLNLHVASVSRRSQDDAIDIFPLAFVNSFFGTGGAPVLDLANVSYSLLQLHRNYSQRDCVDLQP